MLTLNSYPDHPDTITGFGFVCPSLSPYNVGVSKVRIYKMNMKGSAGVIDYTQFRLKDINSLTPEWLTEYSFRNKYKLPAENKPITLQQILDIKNKIFKDEAEKMVYMKHT